MEKQGTHNPNGKAFNLNFLRKEPTFQVEKHLISVSKTNTYVETNFDPIVKENTMNPKSKRIGM